MRFRDVQHQDRAISILCRALRSGRTHHAYLFDGPEGVGKERAARALAARLLCEDESLAPDDDACEKCNACRLLASDNHPDFQLIHRGLRTSHPDPSVRRSKGLFLVVDLIRHFLIEPASMRPTLGRRRVFVIRDAERMNEGAQNALLKTLEEPPGTACLILITSSASRLLPTIRSRCQCIPFALLPPQFVADQLVSQAGLGAAEAMSLARLSEGRLGVALQWHAMKLPEMVGPVGDALDILADGDPEAFGKTLVEIATTLAAQAANADDEDESTDESPRGRSGSKIGTDALRDALKLVYLIVAAYYRDAMMTITGASSLCVLSNETPRVGHIAGTQSIDEIETSLHAIAEAERNLDRNVQPQLVCERLAVTLRGESAVLP